jgi:hypothetical protein
MWLGRYDQSTGYPNITISDCTFRNNFANVGAAVFSIACLQMYRVRVHHIICCMHVNIPVSVH